MFDRDIKHYKKTPRTLNEAFGPYSNPIQIGSRHNDGKWALLACVILAVGFGVALFLGLSS